MENKWFLLGIFSLLIAFVFVPFFDPEIQVRANGSGDGVGMMVYGDFASGIELSEIDEPRSVYQSSTWTYMSGVDYIAFRDSTTDAGFRLRVYMSSAIGGNFVYSGPSNSQTDISLANFKLFAGYVSEAAAPNKGVDDVGKTLNILSSDSCEDALNLALYDFHPDFFSELADFGLVMSSIGQDYFTSSADCEVEGRIKIQRMELYYPPDSNAGLYESVLVLLIIDGSE